MWERREKYSLTVVRAVAQEERCQLGRKQAASLSPITPADFYRWVGEVNLLTSYERNYFPTEKERWLRLLKLEQLETNTFLFYFIFFSSHYNFFTLT